jgi:tol-pal system protein YbgF
MKSIAVFLVAVPLGLMGGPVLADTPTLPAAGHSMSAPPEFQGQVRLLAERVNALELQIQSQGALTLLNQLSELKQAVARLHGQQEEIVHRQQLADKRVKDLYADVDARLKALAKAQPQPQSVAPVPPEVSLRVEPVSAVKAPVPSVADPDAEGKAYEAALNLLREAQYSAATKAFQGFIQAYPNATLSANAMYWLGLSLFSQGDFKAASATQQRLLKDFPHSSKAPDAMVNLARTHLQMGEAEIGKRWLDRVVSDYPASKAAETARKMQDLHK